MVATESRVAGAPVVVCLFGAFGVMKAGADVPLRPGGKTEALISELALHDAGASRDELVTALWPGADPDLAAHSLRSLLHSLHQQFGDALHGAAPVVRAAGRYSLNWDAGVATDVATFEATAGRGDEALRRGDRGEAMAAYAEAVGLYRGDLCIGSDVRHVIHRERLRLRYLTLRAALGDYAFRDGQYRLALGHASALLQSDPCREDAYRLAMRCHVRLGERAQALREYQICRDVLRAEFDAEPEPATTSLYDDIRLRPGSV